MPVTGAVLCWQSFIFMTVVYFGPLTCSIITTTRKFFTILASVVLFANPISPMQWVGTILVFLGEFGMGTRGSKPREWGEDALQGAWHQHSDSGPSPPPPSRSVGKFGDVQLIFPQISRLSAALRSANLVFLPPPQALDSMPNSGRA